MADNLYWLSRYVERAENLARILDVAQRLSALPSAYAGQSNEWESAIATATAGPLFAQSFGEATRDNVVSFIVDSPHNPSSIRNCLEIARTNARSVRTAITMEMWEILNDAWNDMRRIELEHMSDGDLARFLDSVKTTSLRFDGASHRTMLRTDQYWFQRLGSLIERADSMARLLDVKYHVLLPEQEPVGGGLDYFQWASLLRGVNALTSFHWVYRGNLQPWLVAEFLILRREQPRSLISCVEALDDFLDKLADAYGRQGPAQQQARRMLTRLHNTDIDTVFQGGLHEFLIDFIGECHRLGQSISEQYLQ